MSGLPTKRTREYENTNACFCDRGLSEARRTKLALRSIRERGPDSQLCSNYADQVVGRVMRHSPEGQPWFWSITVRCLQSTHDRGYSPSREGRCKISRRGAQLLVRRAVRRVFPYLEVVGNNLHRSHRRLAQARIAGNVLTGLFAPIA